METVGALASGIAHNLNNIIGAILGQTELPNNNAQERCCYHGWLFAADGAILEQTMLVAWQQHTHAEFALKDRLEVGLVPKEAKPQLVELVAAERIIVDPTPRDRGLDRHQSSACVVGTQKEPPHFGSVFCTALKDGPRLPRQQELAVAEKFLAAAAEKLWRPHAGDNICGPMPRFASTSLTWSIPNEASTIGNTTTIEERS
jgi:hypothetical protein